MKSRDQLIETVKSSGAEVAFSARELAQVVGVPLGTMNGWLSDRRAFPPREIGTRRQRVYDSGTLKRICVYLGATSQGLGLNAGDVKLLITQLEVDETWGHYVSGMPDLANFMISKRNQILGE